MEPFHTLTAVALPLEAANVDTDQIIPARFLRKSRAGGYGQFLFHDLRGAAQPILDDPAYTGARILVADRNFGCGSSREGAVWALVEADAARGTPGFRAVVAPSFGEIFRNNASKNGLLAVSLPPDVCAAERAHLRAHPGATMTIDLERQTVRGADGSDHAFEIDPFTRRALLLGEDDVSRTMGYDKEIAEHEERAARIAPWLPR